MDWAGVDLSSSTTQHNRYRSTYEPSDQQHRSEPWIHIFVGSRRTRALRSPDAERWRRHRPSMRWWGSASGRIPAAHRRWLVQSLRWPHCTARIDCVPWDKIRSTEWPVLWHRSRARVDRVECDGRPNERGTEVEKAEKGDGARVCRLINVRHDLNCSCFGWSMFPVGRLQLRKELKSIEVANNLFICRPLQEFDRNVRFEMGR